MNQQKTVVTFVSHQFIPALNGGQKGILGYQEYLSRYAKVVTLSANTNPSVHSSPIHLVRGFEDKKWKYFNPCIAWKLYQLCKQHKASSLLVEQPYGGILGWIAARLAGVKLVVYARNIEYLRFKTYGKWWWILLFPLEYFVFYVSDKILFVSYDELEYVVKHLRISQNKCIYSAHGTHHTGLPQPPPKSKQQIASLYGFQPEEKWFIFYGLQSYQPNWEAVLEIVERIAPLCQKSFHFPFRFIIAGGGLPQEIQKNIQLSGLPISYLGFVEDIDSLVQYADAMVNPIYSGGGVKTKVIEAIALNTTVVSYFTGSLGMHKKACGEKLRIVADRDAQSFVSVLQEVIHANVSTPSSFYEEYFWDNVVKKYPYL
ncbi:MAG: glycosyltransferase [Cytophagales bacterium]|nr:glycosyltransferase [Cytophagales bacterium]MDW8385088.1 glycosyltransferase family 4 protein [Flammeovirgaceae bacterium]